MMKPAPRRQKTSDGPREAVIQQQIREAIGSMDDVLLYRNTVGVARTASGGMQRFGLCVGSSDLVGILRIGSVGVALFLEVKKPGGKQSDEQRMFEGVIDRFCGIYMVADSVESAVAQLEAARKRYRKLILS